LDEIIRAVSNMERYYNKISTIEKNRKEGIVRQMLRSNAAEGEYNFR